MLTKNHCHHFQSPAERLLLYLQDPANQHADAGKLWPSFRVEGLFAGFNSVVESEGML